MSDLATASTPVPRAAWRHAARACVVVAAIFCSFMTAALGVLWVQQKMHHPLAESSTGQIARLHAQLKLQPASESLKTELREADAAMRQAYWRRHQQITRGAWLLLGGAIVLTAGLKAIRELERLPPTREALLAPRSPGADLRFAQWTIAGMGGAILSLLLVGGWWSLGHPALPRQDASVVAETAVSVDELTTQWPVFRGWGGSAARLPAPAVFEWDASRGDNVLWRSAVPLPGTSSPVIWNNIVVVTGAHESQRAIYGFDLDSGQMLWQTSVVASGPPPSILDATGFAAPTPATDGRRAYAVFATGDIAAVDLATGRKVWEKHLGKPASAYGYASSLAIFTDDAGTKVIVQWDMGVAADGKSRLMALDGRSGKVLWQTPRPVGASWTSPLLTAVQGDGSPWQIVTAADPWVIGYDAGSGAELWRFEALKGDVAPSPAAALREGTTWVFATQEASRRVGIALDSAHGTVEPAWAFDDEGLPDIVSPVSDGKYVWTVISSGVLFCFDGGTGRKLWEHDFGASFHSTPMIVRAGDVRELWLTETTGVTHRLAIGEKYEELGANALGEDVDASMAFEAGSPSRLIIRGRKNLYCIGQAARGPQ